eukprot:3175004-Rhodomonas_salina.1
MLQVAGDKAELAATATQQMKTRQMLGADKAELASTRQSHVPGTEWMLCLAEDKAEWVTATQRRRRRL